MKSFIISFIFIFGLNPFFSAFALQGDKKSAEDALQNIDAVQAIAIANQWKWSKKEIKTYVNSREVVFKFPDGKVRRFPLPKDKMIVAVAPYLRKTHKWITHYMSSCQGELVGEKFKVKAVDQNGKILFDDTITTLRNGFFELWLPRDRRIVLSVQGFKRKARGLIETFDGSSTCITTFQLR